jgi:hypothetical protein
LNDNLEERTTHLVRSLTIQEFLKDPRSINYSGSIFDVYTIMSYRISSLVKEIAADPNIYSLGLFNDQGHLLYLDQKGLLETTSGRPLDNRIIIRSATPERTLVLDECKRAELRDQLNSQADVASMLPA